MKSSKRDKMVRPGDLENKFTSVRWRWDGEKFVPVKVRRKRQHKKRIWRQDARKRH